MMMMMLMLMLMSMMLLLLEEKRLALRCQDHSLPILLGHPNLDEDVALPRSQEVVQCMIDPMHQGITRDEHCAWRR
jgi:hypothetical protein